jgi:putative ABC transport system permease protein
MARPYRVEALQRVAEGAPGVAGVESWSVAAAARLRPDDSESNFFQVYAVPADTAFIDPQMERGEWLNTENRDGAHRHPAVVINSDLVDEEPDIQPGGTIRLEIDGREFDAQVAGIIRTDSHGPALYMNYDDYAYLTRTPGLATHVQVVAGEPLNECGVWSAPTGGRSTECGMVQERLRGQLFQAYEDAGFEVSSTRTAQQINDRNELMFTIIVAFLILMALLLAAVGGLGLATTMSINMLERIREIGVLRAVGASNTSLRKIVLVEGVVIGLLSWLIGVLLSLPISAFLSDQVGLALLHVPLRYHYSLPAAVLWLFALIAIAIAASLGPARDAVRLTIREVLAYE